MIRRMTVLFVIFLLHKHVVVVFGSDPDPVQDFCIPNNITALSSSSSSFPIIHNPCKNSSLATVEDFVFSGIKRSPKVGKSEFASIPVSSIVFPGLNTLGMSFVRADFGVGAVNVPHFHPRATEVAFVLRGKIYSGFVDSGNRVFAKVIEEGEVMVFPRGLVHFQMNVGDEPATILGSFNSQNPGLLKIPNAVFGAADEIEQGLLEKAFGLSSKEIRNMRRKIIASTGAS